LYVDYGEVKEGGGGDYVEVIKAWFCRQLLLLLLLLIAAVRSGVLEISRRWREVLLIKYPQRVKE